VAYRADIEIGVKGAVYLDQLQNKLTQVSRAIDTLNAKEVVVRRTIAGAAYATPAGPGGSGVTRASAVAASTAVERKVAQVRRTEAQAELKIVRDRGIAENYISGIINRRLAAKAQELALEKQQTAEVQKRAVSERRKRAENVIIGGAFPMLFGAGPGAVLGGAAGGLIPGNPMLSVATSALGAVLDEFGAKATELGKTLQDPIANFETLKEASLLASSNQERYIQKLIESGKVAEAQAAIQAELLKKVSTQGVADLQNLGAASSKLSRAWAEFNLQLQTALAGPMAGLLSWLAGVVNIGNSVSREAAQQSNISQGLSGADRAALQREEARILQGANIFNEAQKRQQVSQLYSSYQSRAGAVPTGAGMSAASQEIVQLEKAKTAELQAQVNLATKQLSLSGVDININRDLYATRSKQVALQEYENKLLEIKNSFIGKVFDAERNTLMIREANLNYAAQVRSIDTQVQEAANRAAKDAARFAEEAAQVQERAFAARLSALSALYTAEKESYDIQVQLKTVFEGQESASRQRLKDLEQVQFLDSEILRNERAQALVEAQKTNTVSEVNNLYDRRLSNLNQQYAVQKAQLQIDINRIALEKQLAATQRREDIQAAVDPIREQQSRVQLSTAGLFMPSAELERQQLALDQTFRLRQAELPLIREINRINDEINSVSLTDEVAAKRKLDLAAQQEKLNAVREELGLLTQLEQKQLQLNQLMQQYGNLIVSELGTAMSSAVTAVITGTGTVQEAFATMFQNIGKAFIDMATQMIAQALVMKVLGIFTGGAASSGGGIGAGVGGGASMFMPGAPSFMAKGGFVTGPTRAIVGEGGEAEYVIPASKMRGAMSRYAAGARGASVIPGAGGGGAGPMGGGGGGAIDVRYTVERINSVDYVTVDQFQRGMAQAAQQGAVQGEQRAMRSLKTSAATRRSVGV
jgi:hypothetical protein